MNILLIGIGMIVAVGVISATLIIGISAYFAREECGPQMDAQGVKHPWELEIEDGGQKTEDRGQKSEVRGQQEAHQTI